MRQKNSGLAYSMIIPILINILIITVVLVNNYFNIQSGWADNGDYSRIMTWITSGPLNMDNWPKIGTQEWTQRYYSYWIPRWNLDYPHTSSMYSSALLVWIPGIVINRLFYSTNILYLPIMSLGARILILLILIIIMFWIGRRSHKPVIHYLTLAFPFALLLSTSDVTAFFNTFYQENGAIIFIPILVIIVIVGNVGKKNYLYYITYFIACICVTTSKTAFFYWPIITVPFVIPWDKLAKKPYVWIPVTLFLAVGPAFIGIIATRLPDSKPVYQYNAIFSGTLLLSNNPQSQLDKLGIPEAIDCVGVDLYDAPGSTCINKYQNSLTFLTELKTILNEPQILLKELSIISQNFQNYSLKLGKYAYGNEKKGESTWLNFWSFTKQSYFPKGWLLFGSILVFAVFIMIGWRQNNL
jgi:hypothetical protein